METEKRMAGDYEITDAFHIGDKEVVLGENPANPDERYMVAYCEKNEILASYGIVLTSDSYAEIAKVFGECISKQAGLVQKQISNLNIPITVIHKEDCIPDSYDKSIVGKVIAIKPSILYSEFQRADRQIYLVKGGFGAEANSRGSAVFCKNIYEGKETRFERSDVMGEVNPDRLPEWAKERLNAIPTEKKPHHKDRER